MRYIALLRGINVGGNKKLSMADLRELLSSLGHADVATYIQSGNALFTSPRDDPAELEQEIESRIARELGLSIRVLIRTRDELAAVVDANPFQSAATSPTTLHASFLSAPLDEGRLSEIDARQFEPDEFRVGNRVIYLFFPNGVAGSRLTYDFWERRFGVAATTRNWNTVTKLLSMADGT
jgi:uncharacterized protein (DUF1697 family)